MNPVTTQFHEHETMTNHQFMVFMVGEVSISTQFPHVLCHGSRRIDTMGMVVFSQEMLGFSLEDRLQGDLGRFPETETRGR